MSSGLSVGVGVQCFLLIRIVWDEYLNIEYTFRASKRPGVCCRVAQLHTAYIVRRQAQGTGTPLHAVYAVQVYRPLLSVALSIYSYLLLFCRLSVLIKASWNMFI